MKIYNNNDSENKRVSDLGCNDAKCKAILENALSAHQLVLDHNHIFYPLPYHQFRKLCSPCQNNVCNFWNDNNGREKRIPLDLFRLDLELCAALYFIASTHQSKREIGRKWAEYVYENLELKGIILDRTANHIYDFR